MHHIGMYLLQEKDLEDYQGIKDMAQCMWCSPSSQSKHPAPTDDPQVTVTQASNYCIIVLFDVYAGGHEIGLYIERYIDL